MGTERVLRRAMVQGPFGAGLGTAIGTGPGGGLVRKAAAVTIVNGVVIGKDRWLYLVFDDPRQVHAARNQQIARLVSDATGLIRARGIDCAILLTPTKARTYPEFLPEDWTFNTESERRYALALEALRAGGALVPDLATLLLNHRRAAPGEALFFRNDTHWTPTAAELVATELAAQLSRRVQFPAPRGRATRLGERVQMPGTENDLLNLLPGAERANYQPEPFLVRRPIAAPGRNALVEDDEADVALVGNSFAQPKYNLAPALSAQLGRPVSLTWENHLKGPYRTLLNYLQGPGFKRQRPKVLVWNILEQDLGVLPSDARAFPSSAMAADEFLSGIRQAVA